MTAMYQILVSDLMLASFTGELAATGKVTLPAGLELAGPLPSHRDHDLAAELPGAYWVMVADEGAPPELDGARVALILRLEDGQPVIAERQLITPKIFYVLVCRECGNPEHPLPMPFESPAARGKWAADHTRVTGHDKWRVFGQPAVP